MFLLVACSSNDEIIAQKITSSAVANFNNKDFIDKEKSCDKVICTNGYICEEGECICKGKVCSEKCILNGCCEDDDCKSNEHCVDFKCVSNEVCEYHQEYDKERSKCFCEEGFFYCDEQKKCLSGGSCCHQGDCDRYSKCVETSWAVNVCFQYPNKKLCRMLKDLGINENVITPEGEFFVMLDSILSGGIVKIKIDNESFELVPEKRINAAKGTVWIENIKVFGGTCKVEEE